MAHTEGMELKTIEWGAADAPHVALLVHGLTGRGEAFETLVEKLNPAAGIYSNEPWRFVAPDLRGRGRSRELTYGEGGIPEHAQDLLALLDREGLERVVFIGHSLGAMIGVYLAAYSPNRVSGLVLIDGGSNITDEIDALLSPAHDRLQRTYPSREAYIEYVKSTPIFQDRWDAHLQRYFGGDVQSGEDGEWHPVADLETIRNDREKMYGFPLSELWPYIECPTLILLSTVGLAGPEEGFILPPRAARRIQQTISDSILVEVENTNHYDILYSAPETTVEVIGAFLSRLEA